MSLPQAADQLIDYRFPDALDMEVVRHSDQSYTVTLMDLDYVHYTFRLNLALDGRWTLAPIYGFAYGESSYLGEGWLRGGAT